MLDNWVRELKLWCPSLKVVIYYGKVAHSGLGLWPHRCNGKDVTLTILHFRSNIFLQILNVLKLSTGSVEDRRYLKHDILNEDIEYSVIVTT